MKKTDKDEIWQLQTKQSVVSLIPDKVLQEVLSLMLLNILSNILFYSL